MHDRAAVSGRAAYKDEVEWLWALWSAHNTYAYVRLWYAFLARIDSLQSHLYSVAILLAGATAGGQAVGFVFVPLLVAACYAYQAWLHRSAKGLLDRLEAIEAKAKRRGFATAAELEAEAADLRLALLDRARAGQESEIPNFKGSYLGHFPLVSADFWTSDHPSERFRRVDVVSVTRARRTLTLKRR